MEERIEEILSLSINDADEKQLKAILGPLVKMVDLVASRFKRPEQKHVSGRVALVMVDAPTDFTVVEGHAERVDEK